MDKKKQQTILTYNTSAEAMAQKFDAIPAREEDVERFISFLKKKEPFVLELGCGSGRDARVLFRHTKKYFGIDVSKELVAIAKKNVPEGRFEVADMEQCDFPKNLDGVFAMASLLHSDKEVVETILGKAHAALVQGGVFYISLKKGMYDANGDTKKDEFGTRTYYYYTPEDIENLAGSAFTRIYTGIQERNGQEWFTVALRKK